jgi:hypothetical protein
MALSKVFSPRNGAYNAFLFAAIGDQKNGMVVTVASALARLGFDPWNEAGRLAGMPRLAAASALARMIAMLPAGDWQSSDSPEIATRLAELLPPPDVAVAARAAGSQFGRRMSSKSALWIVCLMLLGGAIFVAMHPGEPPPGSPSSSSSTTPPLR